MNSPADHAIIVTGASGGIGAELARLFAADGPVVLIARSSEALARQAEAIGRFAARQPLVLPLDLTERGAGDQVEAFLATHGLVGDILVNNAGYGLNGPAAALSHDEQLGIVDLNVRALTDLTLRFLPGMVARQRGGILNVASVASFVPGGPYMAVYYASKAFVLSFTEAVHEEVDHLGVQVSALCPGPTATAFGERAHFQNPEFIERVGAMSAAEVAEIGYRRFKAGHRVIVAGMSNKLAAGLSRFAPSWLTLRLVAEIQRARAPGSRS